MTKMEKDIAAAVKLAEAMTRSIPDRTRKYLVIMALAYLISGDSEDREQFTEIMDDIKNFGLTLYDVN